MTPPAMDALLDHDRPAFGVPHRIAQPNSQPRRAALIGLGEGGAGILDAIREQGFAQIELHALARARMSGRDPLSTIQAEGERLQSARAATDMIFVAAQLGDDVSMATVIGRIGRSRRVPVTGLLMVPEASRRSAADDAAIRDTLRTLRASVEMLVVSSDESYIAAMLGALAGA